MTRKELARIRHAILPLCLPVIIIGGIRLGICTPTEAGSIAVVYSSYSGGSLSGAGLGRAEKRTQRERAYHGFRADYRVGGIGIFLDFDQRADSAVQCVKLLNENEEPVIRTATTYVIEGDVTEEQLDAIKHHCINR